MTLALPSQRDEAWRWTDLEALRSAAGASTSPATINPTSLLLNLDGPKLIYVDGQLDPRSETGALRFETLSFDTEHSLGLRTRGHSGVAVTLDHKHGSGETIQIVHLSNGGENHVPAQFTLAQDVPASIVETFVGSGWSNRMTRITLDRGARLMRSVRLLQDDGFVSLRDEAVIGEGASLISTFLAAGAAGTRIDGALTTAGEGAYAEASGALLARGSQRHDTALVLHHGVPTGTSRQVWRSVADDQSACSVAARVEVARHAQKTDAEQSLKGIMLSRSATINAKPELEIFADDVKCAHGATVGELDRNALFYLATRGVPEAEAKSLLTRAFVADAIERVGDETVRAAFYADVEKWFANVPLPSGEGGARRVAVGG